MADESSNTPEGGRHISKSVKNYTLFILVIVYAFNFIDRQILVILQPLIKVELDLSDTQLGVMSGIVFALFYTIVGIPIARLADSRNRRNIIAISLTLWSGMTAISGLATNYMQLLLARLGVGVGEAGGSPPAHSMISDLFEPKKRATALAIYSSGIYLGILLGFSFGGYLGQLYGWRITFFVVGLPGVLLAAILWLTVPEPARGVFSSHKAESRTTFREVLKTALGKKSFTYLSFGCAFAAFIGYGTSNFMPMFLIQYHGMSLADAGMSLALVIGISGMIGTFGSGYLADKMGSKDLKWYLKIPAIGAVASLPFLYLGFNTENTTIALICYFLGATCNATYLPSAIAMAHSLVSPAMRATVSAILFLIINLIGMGLGPVFVGAISDISRELSGTESLHIALTSTIIIGIVTATLFTLGSRHITSDVKRSSESD